jgi:hypothetical protein
MMMGRAQQVAAAPSLAAPPRTFASTIPGRLPPHRAGCYHLENGAWRDLPCTSEEKLRALGFLPPQPETAIQIEPQLVKTKAGETSYTAPIVWGSFEFGWLSDPRQAAEVDSINKQTNSYSIQLNSEAFKCSRCATDIPFAKSKSGDLGWVQFTFQALPKGGNSSVCVWMWDWTTGYHSATCTIVKLKYPLTGAQTVFATGLEGQYYGGEVNGYVDCSDSGSPCLIETIAYVPWAGGWYSAVTNDTIGVSSAWHQASGGVFGFCCSSKAGFSSTSTANVQMIDIVRAYSCISQAPVGNQFVPRACTPRPANVSTGSLQLSAEPLGVHPTAEGNNFTYNQNTFQCATYDCWAVYKSTAP